MFPFSQMIDLLNQEYCDCDGGVPCGEVSTSNLHSVSRPPSPRLVGIEPNPGPARKRRRISRTPRVRASVRNAMMIPQLSLNPSQTRTYRFVRNVSGLATVTVDTLMTALGCLATSSTSVTSINTSIRLVHVHAWGIVSSSGGDTFVSLNFQGYEGNPNVQIQDSSNSTAFVPFISQRPPPRSNASFWHSVAEGADTIILFSIDSNGTAGTVVDVTVESIYQDQLSVGTSFTTTGVTTGNLYYSSLDTDNYFIPIPPLPYVT
jgi:hypothetical protein